MRLEPRSRGRGERAQPNGRLDSMFGLRVACEVPMVVGEVLSLQGVLPEAFLAASAVEQSLEGAAQGSRRAGPGGSTKPVMAVTGGRGGRTAQG